MRAGSSMEGTRIDGRFIEGKHHLYRIAGHHRVVEPHQCAGTGIGKCEEADSRERGAQKSANVRLCFNTFHGCFLSLLDQRYRR